MTVPAGDRANFKGTLAAYWWIAPVVIIPPIKLLGDECTLMFLQTQEYIVFT